MDDGRIQVLWRPLAAIVLAVLLAAGAAVFMATRTAYAEVSGTCTATIAGVDVTDVDSGNRSDDIKVSKSTAVAVTSSAPQGFRSHKVQLEFAGRRWTVSNKQDNGSTTWSDNVNVDDYARYGVGLYKVVGVATLTDGTHCAGAATVDVSGNPLTTVAGGVAAGAAALGTVGGLVSGAAAATSNPRPLAPVEEFVGMMEEAAEDERRRRAEDRVREAFTRPETSNIAFLAWLYNVIPALGCFCLAAVALVMTPLLAVTGGAPGGGGSPPSTAVSADIAPKRLPRAPWRPRLTLLGTVSGIIAGAGLLVLLQQYSVAYPTLGLTIMLPLIGAVVYGLGFPTAGYTIGWWRINGRVSALERSLGWS